LPLTKCAYSSWLAALGRGAGAARRVWAIAVVLYLFAAIGSGATTVSVVDVMVLYTPQARTGAGSEAAIRSQVDVAMAEANYVLQLSRVNARLRAVHVAEVPYIESGRLLTNLIRLQLTSDGYLDEVHALRNQHRADLVCLITENGSDYWFYGLQGLSASNAFSVIRRRCLTGEYFFPVTLSFNFGCQLERPFADSVGAFPFSYGHTFDSELGRLSTVEAFSEERRPYFSNPAIIEGGAPAGVPAGLPEAADNARTLNLTAPVVAGFRGEAASTLHPTVRFSGLVAAGTNRLDIPANSNLFLTVSASDEDGVITRVEYWRNDASEKHWRRLGVSTSSPFSFEWTNLTSGSWQIFAPVGTTILPQMASGRSGIHQMATLVFTRTTCPTRPMIISRIGR